MSKQLRLIKSHQPTRADYVQLPLLCPICKKINHQSRKFRSPYAILYHLTNSHNHQDEIVSSVSIDEIRFITKSIAKAFELKMFVM